LPNGPIQGLESGNSATDNVVVVDLTTGSILDESNGWVTVDKSRGFVTLTDADPNTDGLQVRLMTGKTVDVYNRTFRVLYRARNEWAVQLVKPTSSYAVASVLPPLDRFYGQYFVGDNNNGLLRTRIYFPRADINRKVTIDRITYLADDGSPSGVIRTIEGQDFLIGAPKPGDTSSLPYIDLQNLDGNAQRFVTPSDNAGDAVYGVKGASVSVRVLWNPDAFSLTPDGTENMKRVDLWARGWRKSMTETYLRAEETR